MNYEICVCSDQDEESFFVVYANLIKCPVMAWPPRLFYEGIIAIRDNSPVNDNGEECYQYVTFNSRAQNPSEIKKIRESYLFKKKPHEVIKELKACARMPSTGHFPFKHVKLVL